MPERRYTDEEIAAIFREAAEGAESQTLPAESTDGLTLAELHGIAREVGLSPVAVTRAAQSLDLPHAAPVSQRFLGLPIRVQRTVPLTRRLTDAEWERLVVELRQVFGARGAMRATGSMREWSNGNLHALLEPTATGYQLRLGTYKANARSGFMAGGLTFGVAAVLGVTTAMSGSVLPQAPMIAAMLAIGTALIARNVATLPGWARRRGRQMDEIAEVAMEMTQHGDTSSP